MAVPTRQLYVSRYLLILAVILAGLYSLVFLTGDRRPQPRLGLDLRGGTTMTLRAVTRAGGRRPTPDSMDQARRIIADRVDSTGVAEAEVFVEGGTNVVVNVAARGVGEDRLRALIAPAQLAFREVKASVTARPDGVPAASASANPATATLAQVRSKLGGAYPLAERYVQEAAHNQVDPSQPDAATLAEFAPFAKLTPDEVAALPATMQFFVPTVGCGQLDTRAPGSISDAGQPAVACDRGRDPHKYLLDVAKVTGSDVTSARAGFDLNNGGWNVTLSFSASGGNRWTELTQQAIRDGGNGTGAQVAIVLDNDVVSAPGIREVITGDAVISGPGIDEQASQTLATQLRYGSLPVTFDIQSLTSISPTLGSQQLRYGLLAGAIGLSLVVAYCLGYYRALGLVVVASLAVSATLVFGSLVVLGRMMGFTLTLPGIAGFIVAIGITADSFVVLFERLKDEVRQGRTMRSSVPRAWVRARRTILSADAVSFLAAAILYWLATGAVKGFAFTLGLSTILDLLIVFLFTHPLVALLSRSTAFSSPQVSGLGALRRPPQATPHG